MGDLLQLITASLLSLTRYIQYGNKSACIPAGGGGLNAEVCMVLNEATHMDKEKPVCAIPLCVE